MRVRAPMGERGRKPAGERGQRIGYRKRNPLTRRIDQPPHTPPQIHNEAGSHRVLVTKPLPGDRWLQLLTAAGARVEVCTASDTILSIPQIKALIGDKCDGVIGQLTEVRAVERACGWVGEVGGTEDLETKQ